jgi:predicted ATP-dependent endonuclease of OLD family
MYLKYFQIVNYKNLKNARFKFCKGANTIIGENDSGKSNAMTAMRILLDNDYYFSIKKLRENDFSNSLDDWRGHWIILSAFFDEITAEDLENEICAELNPEQEDAAFLKSYIRCEGHGYGTITLFIRPGRSIRKALFSAKSSDEFNAIRSGITLRDYEFSFTSRSQADFTDPEIYKSIVGDIQSGKYANPDEEDARILGAHIDILNVWQHISLSFIDALRDAESEMHKPKNPLRRIFDTLQDEMQDKDIDAVLSKIHSLNESLSKIPQISNMGKEINKKLQDIVGLVYSPEIRVESRLKEDINSVARYLSLTPYGEEDIDELGLGHLNILFIALKLLEFEANRNHEILNIMIVEEPEAHIHTHIQRTLFDNLKVMKNYTQVMMTTHSTHISEVSNIMNVNILKVDNRVSTVMSPTKGLDCFGTNHLNLQDLSLSKCLERYLDAKRSVLLFSKGVILVEGDAEDILIPAMVKKAFGVSLDELGIGVINVGNIAFEYVASIFDNERVQRSCSIITDFDARVPGAEKGSAEAETRGLSRKNKLEKLYHDNPWVNSFYAPHTFEVDFFEIEGNREYLKKIINNHYSKESTIKKHINAIDQTEALRYDSVLTIAEGIGKGWFALLLSQSLDCTVQIPKYILSAIVFASREVMNMSLAKKMILNVLDLDEKNKELIDRIQKSISNKEIENSVDEYIRAYPDNSLSLFLKEHKESAKNGSC